MFTDVEKKKIKERYGEVLKRITEHHISCFKGHSKPVFLISDTYPGIWLEHAYDPVFFAKMYPEYMNVAKNSLEFFIDNQKETGQLPCYLIDRNRNLSMPEYGYSQIQECVSFTRLCYEYYQISKDSEFFKKAYDSCSRWQKWYENYRMPGKKGLVETFCGHDTGHDGSGRKDGMVYYAAAKDNDASVYPENDPVLPMISPDVNAVYYGTLSALGEMADELGRKADADKWRAMAEQVKEKMLEICYDAEDKFFYDVDKNGRARKYLSISITNVFSEHLLDQAMFDEIYEKHMQNEDEFLTPYPFPSMAKADPTFKQNADGNSWGFYSQALTVLRCTRWMDYYGKSRDFDEVLEKWVRQWTFTDKLNFGQELNPITGEPSVCSQWYSSCMLIYMYAARRLGIVESN